MLSLFPSSYYGNKDISKFLEAGVITTTTTTIDAFPRRALKATHMHLKRFKCMLNGHSLALLNSGAGIRRKPLMDCVWLWWYSGQ